MNTLLLLVALTAHPDIESKVLLDDGLRLVRLEAKRGAEVQIDPSQPVLVLRLNGEFSRLPEADKPNALLGPKARCEPPLHLDFGAELLLLQAAQSKEEPVGPPLKQKCSANAPRLERLESHLGESFELGALGRVRFLHQSAFAYAGELQLNPKAAVASHRHELSDELIYVLEGSGTVTLGAEKRTLTAGQALRIPKGTPHAFDNGPKLLRAIQFYLPAGPEERFRPKVPGPPPPLKAACKTDRDCGLVAKVLKGPLGCCASCEITAGNRAWVDEVNRICTWPAEQHPCKPLPCGPVALEAVCESGQCTAVSGSLR